jgi:hypothetical protein
VGTDRRGGVLKICAAPIRCVHAWAHKCVPMSIYIPAPCGFPTLPGDALGQCENTQRWDNNYTYYIHQYIYIYIYIYVYICVSCTSSYSYIVPQPHPEGVCANGQTTVFLCVGNVYRHPVGCPHCLVMHQPTMETHNGKTTAVQAYAR